MTETTNNPDSILTNVQDMRMRIINGIDTIPDEDIITLMSQATSTAIAMKRLVVSDENTATNKETSVALTKLLLAMSEDPFSKGDNSTSREPVKLPPIVLVPGEVVIGTVDVEEDIDLGIVT